MSDRRAERMVIVEDDEIQRSTLKTLFETETELAVSAHPSAESFLAAEEEVESPAVMLVDLGLPGMSGIELIEQVKDRWPELDIVVHTISEDRDTVFAAIMTGASGYLLKGASPDELLEGIRSVREGGAPITPKIARAVIRELKRERTIEAQHVLTSREREILARVADGLAYKEIASALNLSVHTVHAHIKKVYQKLHVRSKREAVIRAKKRGIL